MSPIRPPATRVRAAAPLLAPFPKLTLAEGVGKRYYPCRRDEDFMAPLGKHISTNFESALQSLRNNVLMMSSLTERLLNFAMEGLLKRDNDLCNLAIADDEEVDSLEKEIDREGIDLLIRFHPVASDMREVIAAMKLSANLERIADQSVAIARKAKKLNAEAVVPEISLLEPVFQLALAIFRDSMHAFVDRDIELALKMKPRDRELDQLNLNVSDKIMARIAADPNQVRSYLNIILIARALERVGDHATNIAEDAVWTNHAEDIRHTYQRKVED
jgi:phosphate transport system protein